MEPRNIPEPGNLSAVTHSLAKFFQFVFTNLLATFLYNAAHVRSVTDSFPWLVRRCLTGATQRMTRLLDAKRSRADGPMYEGQLQQAREKFAFGVWVHGNPIFLSPSYHLQK